MDLPIGTILLSPDKGTVAVRGYGGFDEPAWFSIDTGEGLNNPTEDWTVVRGW
ncbi:hypothetical protein PBI_GAIA_179 [Mycobacterium phage Gaia]|uniref:Uncharacterized protein n=1 Tax=Mycobacterium phage Gaia TaxID=1486472 RepID=A0A068F903_9CAUD|nr:hypothetical protein VC46_gp057 [Mycobacterium phage Gaia]AID58995.1 hypothetical protein PBI_GAIA_179 [Mycobacterium phage Gaia]AYR00103.1 hypothetical protein PBI_NEBKISS_174 [Mycobacterium phage Nebkiss]